MGRMHMGGAAAAILFLGGLAAVGMRGQSESEQQRRVEEIEKRWLAAEDDPGALEAILADDFVHVLPAGMVSKREQIEYLRAHPGKSGERKRFEDLRIRIYGSAAIANGMVVATAANGAVRKTLFTDVFALRDGKWRAVNAQETPLGGRPGQTASAILGLERPH